MPRWPQQEQENVRQMWTPSAQKIGEELQAYRGGWLEQMKHRVPLSFQFQTFFMLGVPLVGYGAYRNFAAGWGGSTIGAAAVTNALKCRVAEKLAALGKPP